MKEELMCPPSHSENAPRESSMASEASRYVAPAMVERIARVMADLADFDVDDDWHLFAHRAEVIIEAMREPTEDMVQAGFRRSMGFASGGNRMCNGYRAMIDRALQRSNEPQTDIPLTEGKRE